MGQDLPESSTIQFNAALQSAELHFHRMGLEMAKFILRVSTTTVFLSIARHTVVSRLD